VLTWVDDLILTGTRDLIEKFKTGLAKHFTIKDLGDLRWVLGVEVRRDRKNRILELSQQAYVDQILERFGMGLSKPVSTPAEGSLRRATDESVGPNKDYMAITGCIAYLANITRADIAQAAHALGRHMTQAQEEHMTAAKRVLRYLAGTRELTLRFSGGSGDDTLLEVFADSDWGGDHDSGRSTGGYVAMVGGCVVSWRSKLEPTVALSTAEAEYMAACAATQEAIHLRQLLADLGFEQKGAAILWEDNQACKAMAENPVLHKRSKHINIKFHFVRERVEAEEIEVKYIATEKQLADIMTKALPKPRFKMLRGALMGKA
jgi:hypothetical protein